MATLIERARAVRAAMLIASKSLDDEIAAGVPEMFPRWRAKDEDGKPMEYVAGERLCYNGKLYKVKDGMSHTAQADWTPDVSPSLFERIDVTHAGTLDDPIPYAGNMALTSGLYYTQDSVVYRCFRDTGIAVYAALSELVGLYVEVAE